MSSDGDEGGTAQPEFKVPKLPSKYGLLVPKPKEKDELTLRLEKEAAEEAEAAAVMKTDPSIPHIYEPPFWSGKPKFKYSLELIKRGGTKGKKKLWEKGWYLFGRAPICDIVLDHPSISRQHAVIQYKKNGDAFLYDLGSTHGTFNGKRKLKPNAYYPIVQGNNLLRFGSSSRRYILDNGHGRGDEPSDEDEVDVVDDGKKSLEFMRMIRAGEDPAEPKAKKSKKLTKREQLTQDLNDDEDYKFLDEHKDFYKEMYADDGGDQFYDRTGKIERKKRMAKMKKDRSVTETYDTLSAKEKVLLEEKLALEEEVKTLEEAKDEDHGDDELGEYMSKLNEKLKRQKLKSKKKLLAELKTDYERVAKLARVAKPALFSLTESSNITNEQIARIHKFKEEIKARKRETDQSDENADAVRVQNLKTKMKEMGADRVLRAKALQLERRRSRGEKITDQNPSTTASASTTQASSSSEATGSSPSSSVPEVSAPSTRADDDAPYRPSFIPPPEGIRGSLLNNVKKFIEQDNDPLNFDGPEKRPREGGDDNEEGRMSKRAKRAARKKQPVLDQEVEGAYDTWAPPVNQSGDGRTSLNDKFGY